MKGAFLRAYTCQSISVLTFPGAYFIMKFLSPKWLSDSGMAACCPGFPLLRRVGEYRLPEGSIVIGAGNRTNDNAIVKTMSSALLNRMFHVQMKPNPKEWLAWAYEAGLHPYVTDYISARPDHLFSEPPKTESCIPHPRRAFPAVPGERGGVLFCVRRLRRCHTRHRRTKKFDLRCPAGCIRGIGKCKSLICDARPGATGASKNQDLRNSMPAVHIWALNY